MADDETPGGRRPRGGGDALNLETHPLVAKLGGEGDEPPPSLVTLVGYLGPSRRPDSVRLYADLTFRTYYEVPRSGIKSSEAGPDENSPTRLAVYSDTKIDIVQTSRQSVEAGYLSGAISGGFLGGAASARRPGGGGQVCLTVVTANPTDCGPICLTYVTANPTDCGGQVCLTVLTANPTNCGGPICLTVVTANPTDCGAQAVQMGAAAQQQYCITLYTAHPTWCQPPICLTVVTANPTDCGPYCITLYTHRPTWC